MQCKESKGRDKSSWCGGSGLVGAATAVAVGLAAVAAPVLEDKSGCGGFPATGRNWVAALLSLVFSVSGASAAGVDAMWDATTASVELLFVMSILIFKLRGASIPAAPETDIVSIMLRLRVFCAVAFLVGRAANTASSQCRLRTVP